MVLMLLHLTLPRVRVILQLQEHPLATLPTRLSGTTQILGKRMLFELGIILQSQVTHRIYQADKLLQSRQIHQTLAISSCMLGVMRR